MQGPQDKARFKAAYRALNLVWPLPRRVSQSGDRDDPDRLFLLHYEALKHLPIEAVEAAARQMIRESGRREFFPRPGQWRDLASGLAHVVQPAKALPGAPSNQDQLEAAHRGYEKLLEVCREHGYAAGALRIPAPPDTLEDAGVTACLRGGERQRSVRLLTGNFG